MNIFNARQLTKTYDHRLVVKGIDIECRSGEIIGLLGRNGAGKTTTFQMMVGLIKPDSGILLLNDIDISSYPAPRRAEKGIIYLPQENSVFLNTSVSGNIKMILELKESDREARKKRLSSLLQELGLKSLADQGAHSLSGGERRRLEICRSLVLSPKFLLLDEPFTGIDPLTIIDLQKILTELKESGIGIIISDHNVRDTFQITDRAYIIDEGEILVEGTPTEISSSELAKERFLGKISNLGKEVSRHSEEDKKRSPKV